jgi:hypothetical protein
MFKLLKTKFALEAPFSQKLKNETLTLLYPDQGFIGQNTSMNLRILQTLTSFKIPDLKCQILPKNFIFGSPVEINIPVPQIQSLNESLNKLDDIHVASNDRVFNK